MAKPLAGFKGLSKGWITLLIGAVVLAAIPDTAVIGATLGLLLLIPGLYQLMVGRTGASGARKRSGALLASSALICAVGLGQTSSSGNETAIEGQMAVEETPSSSPIPAEPDTESAPPTPAIPTANPTGSAAAVLEELPIKGRAPKTGYSREQYGQRWADTDRNGCDTRNDVLGRDLTGITYKAGTHECVVLSGTLSDPYTATEMSFERGQNTSSAVQIDHVVALSDSWQKGAQQLSEDQREQFANDPYNLLAVDGPANQQKSDGDAATWLPANKAFRCEYVARQIGVKKKYSLWVTQAEHDAIAGILTTCPGQVVPEGDGVVTEPTADPVTQAATTEPPAEVPAPAQPAPAVQAPAEPAPVQNAYYENCSAVRAAGAAPLYRDDPGYASKLDRDGDGIACE